MAALSPGKSPGIRCTGGWVGIGACLDECGKYRPHRGSNPGPSRTWWVAISTTLSRPINLKMCSSMMSTKCCKREHTCIVAQTVTTDIQPLTRQCLGHCPWTSRLSQRVGHTGGKITFRIPLLEAWHNWPPVIPPQTVRSWSHDILSRIVTGDKTWVYQYSPGNKTESLVWKQFTSLAKF
jgi:hypothetical protein